MKKFAVVAAVSGFFSVALGAFGAHGLKTLVSEQYLQIWHTAAHYQMSHTLIVLVISIAGLLGLRSRWLMISAGCFLMGILFFSGSLYGLVLSGDKWLAAITPVGGGLLLMGWGLLAVGLFNGKLAGQKGLVDEGKA